MCTFSFTTESVPISSNGLFVVRFLLKRLLCLWPFEEMAKMGSIGVKKK
jgi:hypothetical protein